MTFILAWIILVLAALLVGGCVLVGFWDSIVNGDCEFALVVLVIALALAVVWALAVVL